MTIAPGDCQDPDEVPSSGQAVSDRLSAACAPPFAWRGRSLLVPAAVSLLLAALQFATTPSRVWDVIAQSWSEDVVLRFPFWHKVFAPFCGFADVVTSLGLKQSLVLIGYLLAGYALWRWSRRDSGLHVSLRSLGLELGCFVLYLLLLAGIVAWTVLGSRPMPWLEARSPDTLIIDLHSHTNASWDGRKSFSWEENMRWHAAQGFQAGFITDHNTIDATVPAREASPLAGKDEGYRSLVGEELSLERQHMVVLGVKEWIDKRRWRDEENLRPFVEWARAEGLALQLSLPEYWWHHWGEGLEKFFLNNGVHGLEIVNCAPRALDFPPSYRELIIERARAEDLYVAGVSDNHGFGTTCAWNAMEIPGWRSLDPEHLEMSVVQSLRNDGFQAVKVLVRFDLISDTWPERLVSPLTAALALLHSLTPAESLSWAAWVWLAWLALPYLPGARRRRE